MFNQTKTLEYDDKTIVLTYEFDKDSGLTSTEVAISKENMPTAELTDAKYNAFKSIHEFGTTPEIEELVEKDGLEHYIKAVLKKGKKQYLTITPIDKNTYDEALAFYDKAEKDRQAIYITDREKERALKKAEKGTFSYQILRFTENEEKCSSTFKLTQISTGEEIILTLNNVQDFGSILKLENENLIGTKGQWYDINHNYVKDMNDFELNAVNYINKFSKNIITEYKTKQK